MDSIFTIAFFAEWRRWISLAIKRWSTFYLSWLRSGIPLLVTRYEDLVTNLKQEIRIVLQFLHINLSNITMDCMMKNVQGDFHRKPSSLIFKIYSPYQIKLIQAAIHEVDVEIQRCCNISLNYSHLSF